MSVWIYQYASTGERRFKCTDFYHVSSLSQRVERIGILPNFFRITVRSPAGHWGSGI